MRLMEPKSGDRILDLACGQGFFTRALKSAQADVEGVDIGSELIEIARNSMPDVTFHVGSAESPTMIPDASFNKALISLALQNIEHADRAIVSASRILTPKGELHIVLNHPAFRIPKRTSWGFDRKRMVQYRQVDAYLSISNSAIDMHPGMENSPQTISYHRPLQYYFKVFEKAGFAVARLEEWISHKDSDSGPRAEAENTARKEIPLFLYLKVIKLG
jgi:ubiquinone/menaquinone biosynthesis C-methylase UbiE